MPATAERGAIVSTLFECGIKSTDFGCIAVAVLKSCPVQKNVCRKPTAADSSQSRQSLHLTPDAGGMPAASRAAAIRTTEAHIVGAVHIKKVAYDCIFEIDEDIWNASNNVTVGANRMCTQSLLCPNCRGTQMKATHCAAVVLAMGTECNRSRALTVEMHNAPKLRQAINVGGNCKNGRYTPFCEVRVPQTHLFSQ